MRKQSVMPSEKLLFIALVLMLGLLAIRMIWNALPKWSLVISAATRNRMGVYFSMARPDRSAKMGYGLAGAVIGAILIRTFVLMRKRVAAREQMGVRLNQLALWADASAAAND
jgi:hypothetical protein